MVPEPFSQNFFIFFFDRGPNALFRAGAVVLQGSGRRADIRAPPAEVTFRLCVTPFCFIGRAGILAFFAFYAGAGPVQPEQAPPRSKRQECTVRTDQPAERAVERHREEEYHEE